MINQIIASPRRSLQGAINRAKQLPQAGGNEFDPLASTWEDDGVWLGDWGKSEPSDRTRLSEQAENPDHQLSLHTANQK